MKKKIFVILGNQLFNLSFFLKFKKDHIFFLSEDLGLCTYEKHHKQKILLFLSAMRSFRDELENNGFEVIYKKIEDDDFEEAYMVKLKKLIKIFKHMVFIDKNLFIPKVSNIYASIENCLILSKI